MRKVMNLFEYRNINFDDFETYNYVPSRYVIILNGLYM